MKNDKNKTILIILLVIIAVALVYVGIILTPKKDVIMYPEPTPQIETVSFGQEFTIKLGEKVVIADTNGATFKLTGFYNHPCPPNAQCIWSGLDVFYEIRIPHTDGKGVPGKPLVYIKDQPQNVPQSRFNIIIKDSDYNTYATIVIEQRGEGWSG